MILELWLPFDHSSKITRAGVLVGELLPGSAFDEHGYEVTYRAVGERLVLVVDGSLDLIGRQFRELAAEPANDVLERIGFVLRAALHHVRPPPRVTDVRTRSTLRRCDAAFQPLVRYIVIV